MISPDRLRTLRQRANMSQPELAAALGVSNGCVGNWEVGARQPRKEQEEAIADLFNVSLDYLAGRTNETPEYSLEEIWIVKMYRDAEDGDRKAIRAILSKYDSREKEKERTKEKEKRVI